MIQLKKHIVLGFFFIASLNHAVLAQAIKFINEPQLDGYFANPVKGYVTCVGSFAELRRNYFHGGLDIRTGGQVGVPLYAAADGYITRINISAWGYGNCLYIAHPVGYTTVYAHISRFAPKIDSWITAVQYLEELSDIEAYPKANVIPVKKGELIAYSGNSGGSTGPHLHFEVRKTDTEAPTNPLLFNMDITEKLGPKFLSCYLHPFSKEMIQTEGFLPYTYIGLPQGITRTLAPGQYAFTAKIRDYFQSYGENMGINYLEMLQDDSVVFTMNIEQFTFDQTRALNSIIDYGMYKKSGLMAYRFFRDEGNMLPWYPDNAGKEYGVINLKKEQTKPVKITLRAYDVNLKKAELSFFLKVDTNATSSHIKRNDEVKKPFIKFNEDFTYENSQFSVFMEHHTLYNSMYLSHNTANGSYGSTLTLFNSYIPFHKKVNIALAIDQTAGNDLIKFYIKENGKALETSRTGNWLFAQAKYAGTYSIALDLSNPYIKAISMGYKGNFKFSISDGGSGIADYRAEVDGKFMPLAFDGKYASLYGMADVGVFGKGKHTFKLTVTDRVGNTSNVSYTFYL